MMEAKMRTVVSVLSGGTVASVNPVKCIRRNKINMKSPTMSHPKKDPIPNQDINRLITEQDPILPLIQSKYPPVFKPLFNYAHDPNSTEDGRNDYTDNSPDEREDSVNKLKLTNNEDNYHNLLIVIKVLSTKLKKKKHGLND